jgi:hypothetical protein
MSNALHTFITTSYEDIMHLQKFTSGQALSLVSSFVKQIFTELGYVHVTARDSINVKDPWSTAASFLFATLKAHVIMQQFMHLGRCLSWAKTGTNFFCNLKKITMFFTQNMIQVEKKTRSFFFFKTAYQHSSI